MSKTFKERVRGIDFSYPDQIENLVISLCEAVDELVAERRPITVTQATPAPFLLDAEDSDEPATVEKADEDWVNGWVKIYGRDAVAGHGGWRIDTVQKEKVVDILRSELLSRFGELRKTADFWKEEANRYAKNLEDCKSDLSTAKAKVREMEEAREAIQAEILDEAYGDGATDAEAVKFMRERLLKAVDARDAANRELSRLRSSPGETP